MLSLRKRGLDASGVDASPQMIAAASLRVGRGCPLTLARAEDLPFEDNEFDAVIFFNSLEYIEDPQEALSEAFRVASKRVVLVCLNKWSPAMLSNRIKAFFGNSLFRGARFYSLWELRNLVRSYTGTSEVSWCSVSSAPFPFTERKKPSCHLGRFPFGVMIGVSASPVYSFRAEPLALPARLKSAGHTAG